MVCQFQIRSTKTTSVHKKPHAISDQLLKFSSIASQARKQAQKENDLLSTSRRIHLKSLSFFFFLLGKYKK